MKYIKLFEDIDFDDIVEEEFNYKYDYYMYNKSVIVIIINKSYLYEYKDTFYIWSVDIHSRTPRCLTEYNENSKRILIKATQEEINKRLDIRKVEFLDKYKPNDTNYYKEQDKLYFRKLFNLDETIKIKNNLLSENINFDDIDDEEYNDAKDFVHFKIGDYPAKKNQLLYYWDGEEWDEELRTYNRQISDIKYAHEVTKHVEKNKYREFNKIPDDVIVFSMEGHWPWFKYDKDFEILKRRK